MSRSESSVVAAAPPSATGGPRPLRQLLGLLLGLIARLWLATLRVRVEVHPELEVASDEPWVLAFFHGTQWPLLAWKRRRPTVAMVSLSADGAMQARALRVVGLEVVRGSSSRGGARALAALVRRLRRGGCDAAFAVDGPRGPYGVAKPGVFLAAKRAGAWVVPMGSAIARGKIFTRAWDRFALAWPFTRVAVVLGAPISAGAEALLGDAIRAANDRARVLVGGNPPEMVRFSLSSPANRGHGETSSFE